MRTGDTKAVHEAKCQRKVKELESRGWSPAQIEVYMRKWNDTVFSFKTPKRAAQ